jgi:hypothetical protein
MSVILLSPYWNDANGYISTRVAGFNLLVSSQWLNAFYASRHVEMTTRRSFN